MDSQACTLCQTSQVDLLCRVEGFEYLRCGTCALVFLDSKHFLSPEAEKSRYETHNNNPSDTRYREFLGTLATPLLRVLPGESEGLDFGSGPGPTLSLMLSEKGHLMRIYDPYFAPDNRALTFTYDFITATEVVEHFQNPRREFTRLIQMLRPGAWLAIMTKFWRGGDFGSWYYRRDPTHVAFYSVETFHWIAQQWGLAISFPNENVVFFQRSETRQ